jgi:phage portal protein BeeE
MRLLDRITDRYQVRTAQGYYEGMASGAAVLLTYQQDKNRESSPKDIATRAQEAYATNGVVWACVLARMALLSEARFTFRNLTTKNLYGNESLRVLEYPWPNGTTGELLSRMEQDISTAGNAYIWQATPQLLVRLPPEEIIIVSEQVNDALGRPYRQVIGYDWQPQPYAGTGEERKGFHFDVDEIAHWSPYPDPSANYRGMSWMQPVLNEINADEGMTIYKTKYLDHGVPITGIKYAAKLKPETVDYAVERLQNKYGGVANAWRPLILDQGADPIMSNGLEGLDYRNIQAGGELRICSAAGVPPIVVGLKNAESGETYQTAMRAWADTKIRPLWRSVCACLEKFISDMPPKGVQLWYDTSDIAALQAAETERAQVAQVSSAALITLVQAGFTRDSCVAAVTSNDFTLLVPDPNAPTPGVAERETITAATSMPVTGPDSTKTARPAVVGSPPGGNGVQNSPQTPATTVPMPSSFPAAANGKG